MTSPLIGVIGLCLTLLMVDWMTMLLKRSKMPPGPLPLPIIGNTFHFPSKKPWIYIEKLSKTYDSPLITFWVGRTPTIWINDCWTASELLDKRAAIYSSRPRMVVLGDLALGQTNNQVLMFYCERWRLHRRLTHIGVGLQQARGYGTFQDAESKVTALSLLSSPENYVAHYERYAASVVSLVGTRKRVARVDDPILVDVLGAATQASEFFVPGKHFPIIMETFPIMAKFGPLKRAFRSAIAKGGDFYYNMAKMAADRTEDSWVKQMFNDAAKHNLSKEEIGSLTGNLFGAGTDTSSSTLVTFTLACCAFPEVLPRAWKEIDEFVGSDRSPSFEDLESLPYVHAFLKEVFRWRSVAILGGQPHAPMQDDYYKGWLIPKGTSCTGNLWAIHRNERDFPEPDRFCPERYFKNHSLHRPFPNEQGYMTFGWGRRVCSGQRLAEQSMLLSIARLLWAFRIESASNKPVDIFNYTNGVHIRPQPFDCKFTPRNEQIRITIEREGTQALKDLSQYE